MQPNPPSTTPSIPLINWIGLKTLYRREVWRFLKVWNQTVLAPVITTLLFLAVLSVAVGATRKTVGDISFVAFVAPGLIMMTVLQNAFANTSSSLMLAKFQGVIIDILMPPLTGTEITLAYIAGGVTRGVMVGIVVGIAVYCFAPFTLVHPLWAVFYLLASSMLMAILGMLAGVVSQTFDHMAAFTNYLVTPLSFLSGTFFSINSLPEFWQHVSHANPFFFMIDGFRYAMTGHNDGNIIMGATVLLVLNIALWLFTRWLINKGWSLKS